MLSYFTLRSNTQHLIQKIVITFCTRACKQYAPSSTKSSISHLRQDIISNSLVLKSLAKDMQNSSSLKLLLLFISTPLQYISLIYHYLSVYYIYIYKSVASYCCIELLKS